MADQAGGRGELGWTPDSLWFVASRVHSYGRAATAAADARDEARRRLPAYRNAADLRLHEAITLAREGGHREALRLATRTVDDLAPAYRSQVIVHTTRQVQELIPPAQRPGSAFDDYRTVVLGVSTVV